MAKEIAMQDYAVEVEGFILGSYYRKGESIRLHPQQARLFLMEGRIAAKKGKTKAKAD